MSETLKVAIVQPKITWHDPKVNFQNTERLLTLIVDTDLILLPEMWSSGYTMQAHKYAADTNEAIEKMQNWASVKDALLVGSLIVQEEGSFYNRFYAVSKNGVEHSYDKKHLFGYAGEDRIYQAGKNQLIYDLKGWKICANICYDLRFPVWSRNTTEYDVLLYVANWPNPRLNAWDTLLKARAIENQSYVLGCNCFGEDPWKNKYSGHSAALDSFGSPLTDVINKEGVIKAILEKDHLEQARSKFPFLKDRDAFRFS